MPAGALDWERLRAPWLVHRGRGDLQVFAEEDVLEGVVRTGRAVAIEQVDRAGRDGAGNLAPVADRAGEDARDGLLGHVRDFVARRRDHADAVARDLREDE